MLFSPATIKSSRLNNLIKFISRIELLEDDSVLRVFEYGKEALRREQQRHALQVVKIQQLK